MSSVQITNEWICPLSIWRVGEGRESPMGYINISDKEYEAPLWYVGENIHKVEKKINELRTINKYMN